MISHQIFSEKITFLLEKNNQYFFDVNYITAKKKIIKIVEKKFMVRILNVNIHRKKKKSRVIITLKKNIICFKKY